MISASYSNMRPNVDFSPAARKGRGNDEIYSFYLPPLKFNITGVVRDEKTDKVIPGATVKSIGSDGITVEAETNEEGSFRFMLKPEYRLCIYCFQ